MAGNELLYGLVGLGLGVLVLVVVYNIWQERKHRKQAENAFRSDHRDVLLEGVGTEPQEIPVAADTRIEPASARVPPAAPIGRAAEPALPAEAVAIDCVARIEAPAGLVAGAVVTAAGGPLSQIQHPIRWYGLSEETHEWLPVGMHEGRSFTRLVAALQLADRRGPATERELDVFVSAIQRVCDQFFAVPHFAERSESLALAGNVDQFCAAMDVQIAVNVSAGAQVFAGTKLRGLAEAAGLVLESDGCFHAHDESGRLAFVLGNRDAALFSPETLRQLTTKGLTLTLDVPRIADGATVFDRMAALAKHLAEAMHGSVVDDNGRLLTDGSLSVIRAQVQQFQEQMEQQGIAAGGPLALRLFS